MPEKQLGRIQRVSIKECWSHEAAGFTPWLAQEENLNELGATLGFSMEFQEREAAVGKYSLDLRCRDNEDGEPVIIENQFGASDHKHLGQVLTYASGFLATKIVWIAEDFNTEHRAAIRWLNKNTQSGVSFFCVRIKALKIGDSLPAPYFDLVEAPEGWERSYQVAKPKTERELAKMGLYQKYWNAFDQFFEDQGLPWSGNRTVTRPQRYKKIREGAYLVPSLRGDEIYLGLKMESLYAERYYRALFAEKDQIEEEVGQELKWKENQVTSWAILKNGWDLADEDQWPPALEWLHRSLELFEKVFAPRLDAVLQDSDSE
jgi:hypothetical protein